MNEKYLQDLYGWIKSKDASYEGRYSYEQFKQKMQDTDYATKMHGWIATKDATFNERRPLATFIKEVGGSTPVKNTAINQQETVEEKPVKKKFALDSSSEVGSSVSQESPEQRADMPVLTKEALAEGLKNIPKNDAERYFRQQQKELKESLAVIKETEARKIEEKKSELEAQKEFEKQNLGLRSREDFTTTLNNVITSNLTSKTEEDAINELRVNFEKYGIVFEESGFGTDKIIARTVDGKKSTEIDFDNWTEGGNVAAANKLKDFISKNSIDVSSNIGDLLSNSLKAKNLRKVGMLNPDGSTSTVKFTSFEEDGKFKVIPTLFPKDPNNYNTNPNSWTKLQFKEALKLARERGEVFEFKTDKEAREFAKGAWKDINPVDAEADKFYKERGLDYMSNKKTYEEYIRVRDMIDFIEENRGSRMLNQSDERSPKYKSLIINGRLRSDVDELLEKYKAQEEQLRSQVFDAGFISEGKIQKTREEFDEYLDKKQNVVAKEAAQLNAKAKVQVQDAEVKSVSMFGLPVKDLMKYKPKNEQEVINKNYIIKLYEDSKLTQSFAAKKYENAKTYFDAKVNKQIKGEYEDNWSAFSNSVSDAYKNGKAAEQILAFTLGIKDVNNQTDKAEAARIIVENLTNQSSNSSRAMSRWEQASGFDEGLDAFLDNPFELMTTMAATSLSQILPYGSKIVPATTAAGAGTGALTGLLGGPFAEVTVPAGAITGSIQGFRGGMAATSLAMEYTNSVLDVMKEKGYDITDPNQVEQALSNDEVWAEGRERGLKRGIPIAIVDYLSAGLAGKVFKPTSALSSTGRKVALQTTERAVFDPLAEATGELAAQMTAGQEIDWKEISAEAMGGLGNNSSNMAINTYRTIKNSTDINVANNLTDISFVGTESASDERISSWANNMQQLGKIDADVNQRIQENVGLRREAREALSVGTNENTIKPSVLARTMELMSAKEELSSSTNRKELYADKIKAINEELKVIAETKELAPEEQSIDLSTTLGTTKKGVSQYMIDGVRYTKEQFLEKTKNMSARRMLRSAISVKNDEEIGNELKQIVDEKLKAELTTEELTNLLNEEEDAIQIESTTEVPVQSETGISETVAEGISEPKSEVVTEQVTQEEVTAPQTIIEEEKITVFRGKGNNVMNMDNDSTLWVAEDENVAKNYAGVNEEGNLDVEKIDVNKPKKSIELPYKLATEVRASNIGDNLRLILRNLQKEGKISNDNVTVISNLIKDFEIKAGNELELFTSKINKPESREAFSEVAQALGFDSILQKESATSGGTKTNTYGIFKNKYPSLLTEVSLKTQPEIVETVETEAEGPVQKVTESGTTAFNEGVESVQQTAKEYRDKIAEEQKQKQRGYQPGRVNPPALNLFERVSKMMADAYQSIKNEPTKAEVKKAYDALVSETKKQYEFIIGKGLKVIKHDGVGEPYANSQEMLRDIRENNTLKFLPNDVAFGEGDVNVSDNVGLQPSGIKLEDGYELTNSEVFRIVHDYFGHGILGNQFGAIGEENATLQHLDLYSDEAAPAVIFQTRGQNSWVNFSGVNKEANDLRKQARELRKQGKTKEADELVEQANKLFKFAEPKIAIFPTKFNFKRYETARRINEQETIDSRPNKRTNVLSKLLETYSKKSSGTRGVNKRSVRGIKRLGTFDLNVIAEYTLDNKISEGIKKAFPKFKGVQKIYEVTDGDVYRKMMEESLKDNPFAASVTVHSAETFNGMRMFVTEDGSTGITLTKEGFLGGAFSNPNANRPQNLSQLMVIGIKEGATTAEAFDTILPDYYSNFGFKAVSRTAFNEEFKPMIKNGDAVKDWDFETYKRFNNGRPDVVFFIYDGGNRNTIEDRLGLFDLYQDYEKENTESFDKDGYEQAEELMKQQAVKRLEFELAIDSETGVTEQTTEMQESTEPISQRLNEQDLPGYDRMMGEVEGIVQKSKRRGVSEAKTADNVMSYVMGSKVYENATDVQREALVRDVRKRFGLKEKKAPSVARLFGKIKDVKKITMTEKVALKKQIRDVARGARDAVRAFRLASQQLSKDVKELKQSGKITADQAANVIRAFSKVNVFSAKSIDRFTTYMTKVFENADYSAKIKDAKGFRSSLKKLSKNKDKNANLRVAAAQFVKIDPALVEDIETYNEIAAKLKEAITGSSIRGQKVRFAETTNIQEATDYISTTLKEQEQKIREERIAELQELMGVDASEFSAEEMLALLEPEAKTNKYNEGIVRTTIKRAFDVYSAVIKESINSGKDVFTDEDVEYTKAQKELIKKFMNMDTDKMSVKDSLAAVDSLMNFLTNQSTAKMEAVLAKYTGQQNAAKIRRNNIFAVPLKKLGSKAFGRFLGEQTTNLNILFEKMFVGFNRSGKVKDAMGLTDLVNGKSKAQRQVNTIVANYVSKFYNKKANNQKFNTVYNNVERGLTSFMSRTIVGTEAEMQAEFDRRKKLIEESIDVLSIGNEQERKKALVYQEVYDKLLDGSTSIQEVQSKVDPTNLEAVDFWINEWDTKFDELADTSLNIYNKVLDKDLNYTPDRFTRMSYDGGSVDLANTSSAFITNTNGNLYKKETGVLMEATRPEELPKNADSNEAESYIDLSFDKNNSNSMYDALVDINTAAPIRQIEAFMNTADFRKIFGVDADLIKGTKSSVGRIQQYIQNIRNKNPYSNDEFAKTMRVLNKIATLGVGQALAGPTQPLKQVIPVALNTLVNTGGSVDFSAMSNKDFMSWLNETGYAISNRGVESQADIDSINKMIEEAAESKGAKAMKLLENANKKWLNLFLVKPDVWVAVSSWKSYYEQSLKDQGIDTKGIDYSTHEVNKKAADFAQRMVDRQQNISDTDMSGTMFSNKNPYAQTMVKIFMPFASFRMNQGSRLGADLRVLSNWDVSTAEDKKIAARSLAGYAVEMAVFRTISAGIGIGIASMTASLMGKGDDEEEKKKRRESLVKGAVTSVITDVFSPIPVLDRLVQSNSAMIIEGVQKGLGVADEDIKNIYSSRKINFVDALGTFGIAAKRTDEIWDLISLSATGEYEDGYGKKRQISEENRDALSKLVPVVLVSNLTGLASPEVSGVSRNAMKIAKKKSPTPEQIKEMRDKVELIQKMVDEATSPEEVESAEAMLDRVENPERYEGEKEELKAMKERLLVDEETGTVYENLTDLKRYNPDLYEKNFGEGSEYYELNKSKKELDKLFKQEERAAKDEEFGYVPKKKRRKNSDGTYKKYYSSSRSSSGSGSQSSSNSKYDYYDSRGIKTTVTSKSNRSSKYD